MREFKERGLEILRIANKHYEENSHQYAKDVVEDIRKEMVRSILERLFKAFSAQIKNLKTTYIKFFEQETRKVKTGPKQI